MHAVASADAVLKALCAHMVVLDVAAVCIRFFRDIESLPWTADQGGKVSMIQ